MQMKRHKYSVNHDHLIKTMQWSLRKLCIKRKLQNHGDGIMQWIHQSLFFEYLYNQMVKIRYWDYYQHHDNTISLKAAFQDYSGVIQPILFEFDHDSIQNQNDQASAIADYLECSIQIWCEIFNSVRGTPPNFKSGELDVFFLHPI